ncbi:MAG: hypothetical protein LBN05_06280 [Oscillospiraceae bacterium]|jgi:hypothetical protein|nr:hypothetical protein [Oscillospiraceae bacterium]
MQNLIAAITELFENFSEIFSGDLRSIGGLDAFIEKIGAILLQYFGGIPVPGQ